MITHVCHHFVTNICGSSLTLIWFVYCYCISQPLRFKTSLSESKSPYLRLKQSYSRLSCYDCSSRTHSASRAANEGGYYVFTQPACLFRKSNETAHLAFPNSTQLGKSHSLTMQERTLLFVGLHTETYRTSHIYTILFLSLVQLFFLNFSFLNFMIERLSHS